MNLRSLWVCLFILPYMGGCQSRSTHTVVSSVPHPRVIRQVTTTTTTSNPESNHQPAGLDERAVHQNLLQVEKETLQSVHPTGLSSPTREVIKLHEALMSDEVLLTYVQTSKQPFFLNAESMIYLKDIGVSETIIALMLERDQQHGLSADSLASSAGNQELEGGDLATATPASSSVENSPQGPIEGSVNTYGFNSKVTSPGPSTTTTTTVTTEYFQEQLEPYGAWVHVTDYGWCWRPTVAVRNPAWRPYCDDGRWVYSDCGWYWHSYYSWGWAPFHYGRWSLHGSYGWVWVPDTVWGPSWVTWRTSDAYCGWAPLPPGSHYQVGVGFSYHGSRVSVGFGFGLGHAHYAFVSKRHFRDDHVGRHGVKVDQARDVYNHSTVINQYNVVNNNTVINEGVDPQNLGLGSRKELRKVRLDDVGNPKKQVLTANQGNSLKVFRPSLPAQQTELSRQLLNRQASRPALSRPTMNRTSPKGSRLALRQSQDGADSPGRLLKPLAGEDARSSSAAGKPQAQPMVRSSQTTSRFGNASNDIGLARSSMRPGASVGMNRENRTLTTRNERESISRSTISPRGNLRPAITSPRIGRIEKPLSSGRNTSLPQRQSSGGVSASRITEPSGLPASRSDLQRSLPSVSQRESFQSTGPSISASGNRSSINTRPSLSQSKLGQISGSSNPMMRSSAMSSRASQLNQTTPGNRFLRSDQATSTVGRNAGAWGASSGASRSVAPSSKSLLNRPSAARLPSRGNLNRRNSSVQTPRSAMPSSNPSSAASMRRPGMTAAGRSSAAPSRSAASPRGVTSPSNNSKTLSRPGR